MMGSMFGLGGMVSSFSGLSCQGRVRYLMLDYIVVNAPAAEDNAQ
jgi:hypothetical protein